MNKLFILLFLVMLTTNSCKEKIVIGDPCDILKDGIYQFPELPENHNMTHEEVYAFKDLPEDISECITTEGLVETCLNYPYLGLVWAGSHSPQAGYGTVWHIFMGLRELAGRPDRATQLLRKYIIMKDSLDLGVDFGRITDLEMIFCQYENLVPLSLDEKILLIETAQLIYDYKEADFDYYGASGLSIFTSALIGRLMKLDNFQPFIVVYDPDNYYWSNIEELRITNYETTELIYSLSSEYLDYLKN